MKISQNAFQKAMINKVNKPDYEKEAIEQEKIFHFCLYWGVCPFCGSSLKYDINSKVICPKNHILVNPKTKDIEDSIFFISYMNPEHPIMEAREKAHENTPVYLDMWKRQIDIFSEKDVPPSFLEVPPSASIEERLNSIENHLSVIDSDITTLSFRIRELEDNI